MRSPRASITDIMVIMSAVSLRAGARVLAAGRHVQRARLPGHVQNNQVHGIDRARDMLLERPRVVFRLPQRGLQLTIAGHLRRLQRGNPDGRNGDQRERDDRGARGEQSQRGGDNPIAGMQVIHDLGAFSGGRPVRRHQPRFPSVRRSLSQVPHSSAISGRGRNRSPGSRRSRSPEERELLLGLDALGDDLEPQVLGQVDDGAGEGRVVGVGR